MSDGVKRYTVVQSRAGGWLMERASGEWVSAQDFDALASEWRVATGANIMLRAELAGVRAQVERLRKDASRYRFIRNKSLPDSGQALDEKIDRWIAEDARQSALSVSQD